MSFILYVLNIRVKCNFFSFNSTLCNRSVVGDEDRRITFLSVNKTSIRPHGIMTRLDGKNFASAQSSFTVSQMP